MIEFSDITSNVCKAEFIQNSKTVAIASGSKLFLREASIENYHDVKTLPFGESISTFNFSPDFEYCLTLSIRKSLVMVYNIDGEAVAKIEDEAIGIENAIWAPDSRQIITFSNFQLRMTVYNLAERSVCYIKSPKFTNKGFSFTQDGRFMALAERKDTKDSIGIYFTKDWRPVNYFQIDMLDLCDLMWSPNNNFIVAWDSCLNYKLIPICPLMGPITFIQPYESALGIKTVCFSNDSSILAVGSFDEKIRLFNALTWKLICEIECKPTLTSNPELVIQYVKVECVES
jgi:WD40 repeat protein